MRSDRDAAVVRHVEPLVAIDGPGISEFGAFGERAKRRADACPQAECAINMYPAPVFVYGVGNFSKRIEPSGVHIAGLRSNKNRERERLQSLVQFACDHTALLVATDTNGIR